MAKGAYIGVSSKAHKVKKMYIGVDGKARKAKKMYIGVGGKAQLCWSGGVPYLALGLLNTSNAINGVVDTKTTAITNPQTYAKLNYVFGDVCCKYKDKYYFVLGQYLLSTADFVTLTQVYYDSSYILESVATDGTYLYLARTNSSAEKKAYVGYSTDGSTWTWPYTLGYCQALVSANNRVIGLTPSSTSCYYGQAIYIENAARTTLNNYLNTSDFGKVEALPDGTILATPFTTQHGYGKVFYSTNNGSTWTLVTYDSSIRNAQVVKYAYINGKYYIFLYGACYVSTNLTEWTGSSTTNGPQVSGYRHGQIIVMNGKFYGKSTTSNVYSTDGITWTTITNMNLALFPIPQI